MNLARQLHQSHPQVCMPEIYLQLCNRTFNTETQIELPSPWPWPMTISIDCKRAVYALCTSQVPLVVGHRFGFVTQSMASASLYVAKLRAMR